MKVLRQRGQFMLVEVPRADCLAFLVEERGEGERITIGYLGHDGFRWVARFGQRKTKWTTREAAENWLFSRIRYIKIDQRYQQAFLPLNPIN